MHRPLTCGRFSQPISRSKKLFLSYRASSFASHSFFVRWHFSQNMFWSKKPIVLCCGCENVFFGQSWRIWSRSRLFGHFVGSCERGEHFRGNAPFGRFIMCLGAALSLISSFGRVGMHRRRARPIALLMGAAAFWLCAHLRQKAKSIYHRKTRVLHSSVPQTQKQKRSGNGNTLVDCFRRALPRVWRSEKKGRRGTRFLFAQSPVLPSSCCEPECRHRRERWARKPQIEIEQTNGRRNSIALFWSESWAILPADWIWIKADRENRSKQKCSLWVMIQWENMQQTANEHICTLEWNSQTNAAISFLSLTSHFNKIL